MSSLDGHHITFEVQVRYQACDGQQCLMPKAEKLSRDGPLEAVNVPKIKLPEHAGQG